MVALVDTELRPNWKMVGDLHRLVYTELVALRDVKDARSAGVLRGRGAMEN